MQCRCNFWYQFFWCNKATRYSLDIYLAFAISSVDVSINIWLSLTFLHYCGSIYHLCFWLVCSYHLKAWSEYLVQFATSVSVCVLTLWCSVCASRLFKFFSADFSRIFEAGERYACHTLLFIINSPISVFVMIFRIVVIQKYWKI